MTASPAAAGHRTTARPPSAAARRAKLRGVAIFFASSLALGAVAFAAATPPPLMPFLLVVGPAIIALALVSREGPGSIRELLRSLTIRPARKRWYLAVLIPVLWAPATVATAIALGAPTAGLFDKVFPAIVIVPLVVLLPAFIEELAWRGYALPRLMTIMSPLRASLVLAIPWTLIHVVLFLPGQQYDFLAIWPLILSIVSYSILLTWIYIGTGGSVLMTALVHAGLNGVAPIMAGVDADASWAIRNVLAAGIAVAIVAFGGLRRPAPDGLSTTAATVPTPTAPRSSGRPPTSPTEVSP
jgi:membrane protease YdiL (CAAX protease family)